jgi:adenylate cyclase
MGALLETEIPMPGLARSGSQMAAPVTAHGRVLGVLYAESEEEKRFSYDDEDVLVLLGAHLGLAMEDLRRCPETQEAVEAPGEAAEACPDPAGPPLVVRHYAENDSVFLDGEYLIKGVAGSILWALVRDVQERGRCDFSNRELRLDPRIRLPDLSDNLEARLVLLARRLAERQACLQIQKTGRGRFRLAVARPLKLESV